MARAKTKIGEPRAGRDSELRLHQIDAVNLLGDRMFDLKARIGLDEHECVCVQRGRDQKFERAKPAIMRRPRHAQSRIAESAAQRARQMRARRRLDDFLAAALNGAFALPEMGDRLPVSNHLHFDMAHMSHETLDIKRIRPKGRARLRGAARERLVQFLHIARNAHAAPAPAGDRLHHHRAARAKRSQKRLRAAHIRRPIGPCNHRNLLRDGEGARAPLVAEQVERVRRGANEG